MDYIKDIHIGGFISRSVAENGIEMSRICKFINVNEEEIKKMFLQKNMDTEVLLKWSKLLEYDFFRLYSQHLILYAPLPCRDLKKKVNGNSTLPDFRKNLYTYEIISFIMEILETGEKTKQQIIEEYRIPKTTLYKWISKYKNKIY